MALRWETQRLFYIAKYITAHFLLVQCKLKVVLCGSLFKKLHSSIIIPLNFKKFLKFNNINRIYNIR